jgi:hypothetical protein
MKTEIQQLLHCHLSRRAFLLKSSLALGPLALSSLLPGQHLLTGNSGASKSAEGLPAGKFNVPARARRVIYLFQSGGPSQFETFEYKPMLQKLYGQDLPDSIRMGQRLTSMSAQQSRLPMVGSNFKFRQYGATGAWVSELMQHTGGVADDLCFIRSMFTEQINHDPALTFMQTGNQLAGRPSIGSWINYGLGSANENLPAFIVLVSNNAPRDQPLFARLWGNGFLPSKYQGVQFRADADPVLYLTNPDGYTREDRRGMLDALKALNHAQLELFGDPEIEHRLAQYEMAFRMQASVPEITDMSDEPDWVFDLYGPDSRTPGTYAANCLLARRLVEKDVKFVQLYHQGWDQHSNLPAAIVQQCRATDQASAALVKDLKQRGLLDDTLVIWGGEFGRTNYSQGRLTRDDYGRDHHSRCFTMWMAGAGTRAGHSIGETDEFGYNIIEDPVHVHDFQATLLYLMGIDHEQLTFEAEGRRYRLTDVGGKIIKKIIA